MKNSLPEIKWVKNDPKKHIYFQDGSVFLIALQTIDKETKESAWEFDVVQIHADDESFYLRTREGEPYDCWSWGDVEYFHLIDGVLPTEDIE